MYLIRRNKTYHLRFRNTTGKWETKSLRTTDKVAARKLLVESEERDSPQRVIRLSQLVRSAMDYARVSHAASTQEGERRIFNMFMEVVGDKPINNVTLMDIEHYKAVRVAEVRRATVNIELRHVKALFGRAVDWELLGRSPFKRVKMLEIRVEDKPVATREDLDRLLNAARPEWVRSFIGLSFQSGLSGKELLRLHWKDIDLDRCVLTVSVAAGRTSRQSRNVALNDEAVSILSGLPRVADHVFSNRLGRPYDHHAIAQRIKAAVAEAGLDPRLQLGSLRQSFAALPPSIDALRAAVRLLEQDDDAEAGV